MTRLGDGWRRLTRIWRRDVARDVDAEVEFHLSERAAELERGGERPEVARVRAEREFGDLGRIRGELADIDGRIARRSRWQDQWETVAQDFGYVLRSVRRSPAFFAAVSLTFALGIGANAAVFSVLDRLFLAAPPGVVEPGQLRRIVRQDTSVVTNPSHQLRPVFAYPEFLDIASTSSVSVVGYDFDMSRLGRGASTTDVGVTHVLGDYFATLGVQPAIGRFFSPDEEKIDAPQSVAIISQQFWISHFDGREDVVGQQLIVDGRPYTVIGVVRGDFHGLDQDVASVWLPMNTEGWGRPGSSWDQANSFWIRLIARVRTPAEAARLTQSATVFFRQHLQESPGNAHAVAMLATLVEPELPGFPAPGVGIATRLAAMTLVILMIACANVANLFLARGMRRRREIAVRLALGISRRRLAFLLLAESAVAAAIGGVLALAMAFEGGGVLRRMVMPTVRWGAPGLDRHALLFTLGVAVIAALAAGLIPSLRASKPDVARELKIGAREGVQQRSRLRTVLAVTQAALSVVLLAGAAFLVVSLRKVESIPTGYQPARTIFASVQADPEPESGFFSRATSPREMAQRLSALMISLRDVAGVQTTGLTANEPMWAMNFLSLSIPGRDSLPRIGGASPYVFFVSRSYFDAVGIRLLHGQFFRETDRYGPTAPVIVNETMAQHVLARRKCSRTMRGARQTGQYLQHGHRRCRRHARRQDHRAGSRDAVLRSVGRQRIRTGRRDCHPCLAWQRRTGSDGGTCAVGR